MDTVLRAAATDLVSNPQLQRLLPVDGQEGQIGNPFYADTYVCIPPHHDRTNRQQVRAYGGDHQSIHIGSKDRSVGGQVVGGGTRGRGDNDPPSPKRRAKLIEPM